MGEHITPPSAYFEYLRTEDAKERATDWQLRLMASIRWGVEPAPGTFKALRAAMDCTIRRHGRAAE